MADKIAVVLSRDRTGRPDHERLENELIDGLESRADVDLTVLSHLYDLPADGPAIERIQQVADDVIVLSWLYPRSAFWVLDANGVRGRLGRTSSLAHDEPEEAPARANAVDVPDRTIWCLDLRTHDRAEPYLEEIGRIAEAVLGPVAADALPAEAPPSHVILEAIRPRWYPVIDYGRCTNCLECLNFCLFGVFGLDPAEVIVAEQPDLCRPGCPACARICPAGAIMFPEHNDPAIAGDPQASLGGLKLDLSQLFGGQSLADLAAAERDRALAEKRPQPREAGSDETDKPATQDDQGKDDLDKDDLDKLVDELDETDL
jgi:NAD-dependent dihydropyrimidine dehydrogenase PreA subunit